MASRTVSADLFGEPRLPGLSSAENILSAAEEAALIGAIDAAGLTPFRFQGWLGKRLTAAFGPGYDFDTGRIAVAAAIPDWLEALRTTAARFAQIDPALLVQALVTRYDPGAGIGWHRDRPVYDQIVGISLGAPAVLRFRRRSTSGFERAALPLAPRSIYRLDGPARRDWEHSIAAMAATRWSITFRSVSAAGLAALGRVAPGVSPV